MIRINPDKHREQCVHAAVSKLAPFVAAYASHDKVHRIHEVRDSAVALIRQNQRIGAVVLATLDFMIDQRALHRGARYFEEAVASQLAHLSPDLLTPSLTLEEQAGGPF